MGKRKTGKPAKQVAALPVARDDEGGLLVMVITSRETKRFIVPKGWAMKGIADRRAAEIEAKEEAGVIGRAHSKPIGSYLAWKRRAASFQLVKVKVFLLDIETHLESWKEKGERSIAWLKPKDAAALVDEPGLVQILLDLSRRLPKSWRARAAKVPSVSQLLGAHPVIGKRS